MCVVSFNFMHTNDLDKYIINRYTHNTCSKTMNKEAVENEITITAIIFIILITDFSFLEKKYFIAK